MVRSLLNVSNQNEGYLVFSEKTRLKRNLKTSELDTLFQKTPLLSGWNNLDMTYKTNKSMYQLTIIVIITYSFFKYWSTTHVTYPNPTLKAGVDLDFLPPGKIGGV